MDKFARRPSSPAAMFHLSVLMDEMIYFILGGAVLIHMDGVHPQEAELRRISCG